jgi:hypothetical protein
MSTMTRKNIYFPTPEWERLRLLARKRSKKQGKLISCSDIVRDATIKELNAEVTEQAEDLDKTIEQIENNLRGKKQ